ncbi:hypothetical protein HTY52_18130 [Cupriavidus taiwanensis]|nr:hypothetical protein [Cupriavidus taiwanensis]NSX16006.1 hypothetical protein [Cupriavidus taiwanensis]
MSQLEQINELLHRITVAETREVRMALCSQIKRLLAEMQCGETAGGR